MGKQKCILGTNCPNQVAKRNIQFQLSEDSIDLGITENCVFCGVFTAKKKKTVAESSPWSTSSNDNFRMKRAPITDIDSLCGMRSMSKKKKEDPDDKINFYKSQLLNKEKTVARTFTIDSDSDDLSDSGVKSDYESPGNSDNKKNNETKKIVEVGLNVRKGKIISRSPTPESLDESTNVSSNNGPHIGYFKSNGFNKDILNEKSNSSTSKDNACRSNFLATEAEEVNEKEVSSAYNSTPAQDERDTSPPSSPMPFRNNSAMDSDPFELDSDNETTKKNSSTVVNSNNNSEDLSQAGPSSRPDVTFKGSYQSTSTPNNSFETHHSGFKSRFMNLTYMPKHKIERLLYKTFKLQILNEFSSSSDEDDIKLYQTPKKAPKRKTKTRKSAPVKDSKFTSSQKIGSGFYRWKKRRRFQNDWSDDDSNLAYDSMDQNDDDSEGDEDEDEDEDEEDNGGYQVRAQAYSNNGHVNNEHDYSTSEFHKIAEANIDNLAFETEKLNWDDTVMIDDNTMDSVTGHRAPDEIITLDDSPQRFNLPLIQPTDDVVTIHGSDSERSPDNDANTSDHLYCANDQKKEPSFIDEMKQSDENEKHDDTDKQPNPSPVVPQNENQPQKGIMLECPICLESANGQEFAATVCGHVFCRDCIESYLSTSSRCPTCRKEISKKQLITLYI